MEHQHLDLAPQVYRHLVHTLTTLLPPPPIDTPEAWQARDQAAFAKVADLLPVNADEADLAAQCVAARAQAEDILRLIREQSDDIPLTLKLKLNAQYATMVRTSLSARGLLTRVQQIRHKREKLTAQSDTDEWTRHIATREMLNVPPLEPKTEPKSHSAGNETPARHKPRPWPVTPAPTPEPAPTPGITPHRPRQTQYPDSMKA